MLVRLLPKLIPVALLGCGIWWFISSRPLRDAPGIFVHGEPAQKIIPAKMLGEIDGWQITALAEYSVRGRVLGTKRYRSGPQSGLVPVDVAIGWGRMSDQAVLDALEISMTNRFYFYEWKDAPPIPADEIKVSSANNHVIAANDSVRKVIGSLRVGQIVTLKGFLVNANGPEGISWKSSLTRTDSGNGACELFYVETAKAVNSLADEM